MPILCYLFENNKNYNIAYDRTRNLSIQPGATVEVSFRFESLQLGNSYIIGMQYYTDHQSGQTDWLDKQCNFTVNEIAGPTDGIADINAPVQPMNVYSLSGVLLKKNATSLDDLPNGIYIIGGRKQVVNH